MKDWNECKATIIAPGQYAPMILDELQHFLELTDQEKASASTGQEPFELTIDSTLYVNIYTLAHILSGKKIPATLLVSNLDALEHPLIFRIAQKAQSKAWTVTAQSDADAIELTVLNMILTQMTRQPEDGSTQTAADRLQMLRSWLEARIEEVKAGPVASTLDSTNTHYQPYSR